MEKIKTILFISGLLLGGYGLTFNDVGVQFMSLFFVVGITYLFFKSFEKQDKIYKKESEIKAKKQEVSNEIMRSAVQEFEKGLLFEKSNKFSERMEGYKFKIIDFSSSEEIVTIDLTNEVGKQEILKRLLKLIFKVLPLGKDLGWANGY